MSTSKLASKIRLTIGTKLVGIIALLLLSSVASLVWISNTMFIEDNTALIQQMNLDSATSLSTRMREAFGGVTDKMRVLGSIMVQESIPSETRQHITSEFFSKDKDFLAVMIHKDVDGATPTVQSSAISSELATLGDADASKALAALASEKEYSLANMSRGAVTLVPFRLVDGSAAMAIGIPFIAAEKTAGVTDHFTHTLTAVIRQNKFLKAVSESDTVTSYMLDHRGHLIAHPDAARSATGEDMSQVKIVREMLAGKTPGGQTSYPDPLTGENKLGAFHLVGFGDLGIISEVPEAKAFEAAQSVKRKSMYIALIILCVAFFTGYIYSGTITWPIKQLVAATIRIQKGDFSITLKPKGRDELATLSGAFNDMATGLEERDRVKATFNKFHNKEIAEKLLSGEVNLGGERKEATIFFSDVRGFTAMSETMEPEQVVEMLNEYMTRMVRIIRHHHGIVDKYVGDAIMAIWGVPLAGEDDQGNAVKACIDMRKELADLNALRISRGQGPLRIGMGLNTGQVIAGNIGSDEKMEYTVIGDAVNLASRMESMTKEYGTDFLIPKVIQENLKDRFIFEQRKSAKVKGKSQAIEVFTVKGFIDEQGNQVVVETPYSSYESEKSDKGVHDEPKAEEVAHEETVPVEAVPEKTQTGTLSHHIMRMETRTPVQPDDWFVQLGTEALGPFTEKEVFEGVVKHEFTESTKVSVNREGPWLPIAERPEFTKELVRPAAEPVVAVAEVAVEIVASPPPFAPPPAPAPIAEIVEVELPFEIQPMEIIEVTALTKKVA